MPFSCRKDEHLVSNEAEGKLCLFADNEELLLKEKKNITRAKKVIGQGRTQERADESDEVLGGTSWGISGLLVLEIINTSPDPQGKGFAMFK